MNVLQVRALWWAGVALMAAGVVGAAQAAPQSAQTPAALAEAAPAAASFTQEAPTKPRWEIKAGENLRSVLDRWCVQVGYRLVWNVESGYRSQADLALEGDFHHAVADLFAAVPQELHLRVEIAKNKLVLVSMEGKQ